jgi:hypothetical protein
LGTRLKGVLNARLNLLDSYSRAHLGEASLRIDKAIDAGYVLNSGGIGGGGPIIIRMGQTNGIPTASASANVP